jgi:hypothetical protein
MDADRKPEIMQIEQKPQQVAMTPKLVDELHMLQAEFANCFPIFLMPMGLARMLCCELTPTNKVLVRGSYLVSVADLVNLRNNIDNILNNQPKADMVNAETDRPSSTSVDKFIEDMKRQAKGN